VLSGGVMGTALLQLLYIFAILWLSNKEARKEVAGGRDEESEEE